jgi:glycosyltransferase involved in cell wall biosynthesis
MIEDAERSVRLDGMRVLVLFGGSEWFGQERANLEVFRQLSSQGLQVRFITSSRWGAKVIQPELTRLGFEWTTAPFGFHWGKYLLGKYFFYIFRNLWGVIVTNWRVWREARCSKSTHFFVGNWLHLSYAVIGIWLARLPLIYRMGDAPPQANSFQGWVLRLLWRRVTHAVGVSKFIFYAAETSRLSTRNMSIIYNFPPTRNSSVARLFPASPRRPALAYVGQIAAIKGLEILVEAAAQLVKRGKEFELWLAGASSWGQNDFENQLSEKIVKLKLEGIVKKFGYVEDIDSLFQNASIHVAPSICQEALGNVVLEAKQSGVPSVVFPDGGLPELIEHRVDGFICRDHSVEALVEGVSWFLDHPEERTNAGAAARRSLREKFGVERFRQQWADVFLTTAKTGR